MVFCQVLRASLLKYRVGFFRVPFKASKMCVHIPCRFMEGRLTIFSSQANSVRLFFIPMCTHLVLCVCQFWMRRNRGSLVSQFARYVKTRLWLRLWLIETPCIDRNWYPGPIERPQHQRSGAERCVHHVQVRISINVVPYVLASKLTRSCCIIASSICILNAQERQSCIRVRCFLIPDDALLQPY